MLVLVVVLVLCYIGRYSGLDRSGVVVVMVAMVVVRFCGTRFGLLYIFTFWFRAQAQEALQY